MRTILVINSKGGAGKTTVTTNLAGYYASQKMRTTILDCDPQGSSLQWLRVRPSHHESIHGSNGAPPKGAISLNSIKAWVPENTEVLIIDAPAGVRGLLLKDLVRRSNFILIPVAPSPIDIHATADFVKDLFLSGGARNSKAQIGVVANRVRNASPDYEPLERFLGALKLPLLSRIKDSHNYIRAVEKGLGVFEMDEDSTLTERQEFLPVFRWLDGLSIQTPQPETPSKPLPDKVVSIDKTSKSGAFRSNGKTLINSLLQTTTRFRDGL